MEATDTTVHGDLLPAGGSQGNLIQINKSPMVISELPKFITWKPLLI
jgi:hypothetical protein